MQQMVMQHLREHGASTVPEIAAGTGRALADVRMAVCQLAPPPNGIGDLILLDGDRLALAPPRPPAPVPMELCSMRQSGKHPAFRRASGGALVCSACGRVKP